MSPQQEKAFKKVKKSSYPAVSFQLDSDLFVEQEEGKCDDFGDFHYLAFKIRDLSFNRMLTVYKYLEHPGYFVSKRHLEPYLSDYGMKHLALIDDNDLIGKRFRDWAESIGDKYRWNSGFAVVDSDLISKVMQCKLGSNLALGLSHLLKREN